MSAPPLQRSRISPINPQLATVLPPTTQSTSIDSRFVYAPWNGHSTHTPQGSPRSIPFHDRCTYAPQAYGISPINARPVNLAPPTPQSNSYNGRSAYAQSNPHCTHAPQAFPQSIPSSGPPIYAPQWYPQSIPYNDRCSYAPQEYRISPVNARTIAFAPPTPQTNPYNGHSAYAPSNGNLTNTPQGSLQSNSFNDPSTYASMNGHSTHASREYWIPPINAHPEPFVTPTPQSNQLIGYPSYTPHTLSVSMGVSAQMCGLITSHISDSNNSTRSPGIQNHDLSDAQDDYHPEARIPCLSSAYSGYHATHAQQQMNGNPQSTTHSERSFKCDQCFRTFKRRYHLEHHNRLAHVERPFKCDLCSRGFMRNCDLEKHQREAHLERPFKCDLCSRGFMRNCDLEKHQREAHLERPFKCDQCSGSFKQNCDLEKHQSEAHVERSFPCEQCPERFARIVDLDTHQKSHPEGYLRCDQCSQTFLWYRDLRRHQRTHLEGKFKCDQCPENFMSDYDLTQHQRIHLEGKKYLKCDHCPKIFKRKGTLSRHQQTHFAVEPIRCLNCGKGYSRTDSLAVSSHT